MLSTMKTTMVLVSLLAVVYANGLPDILDACSEDSDVFSCLKFRAVRLLDSALATDSLAISDYVTVVKDPKKTVKVESLPRSLQHNDTALDKVLMDRVQKYFETRTIQLKVPDDVFEGRKRKGGYGGMKKGGGMFMMMFAGMGAILMKLAMVTIAAISAKALLISKVALLLAGFFGLKSMMGNQHHAAPAQVVYAEPDVHHGGGGWERNTFSAENAHDFAYVGHKSPQTRRSS